VLWIQTSLARLGFLEPPGISGVYDVDTLGGVRAFQRGHRLEPDGVTGPMTQMLLYGALRDYAPPRLDEGEAG
jgi:peptidoglycan hydrolase-like protein with peptidoglycan-binding domain